ncbi:MAG: right-handed parallel beta-helix repeat-containing protein [Ignavibacteriaceae bacterium]
MGVLNVSGGRIGYFSNPEVYDDNEVPLGTYDLNDCATLIDITSSTIAGYEPITTSGQINKNEWWAGNITITGNITVNSGVTLTVEPGAIITFTNGSSLIVNGTLTANGTSTNHITFDFVSPANQTGITYTYYGGSLQYCDIKNSFDGIWGNGALPNNISHCTFTNNTKGLYASNVNSTTNISFCTFQNNSSYGISLYHSSPWISDCIFTSNYEGINCNSYSNPYIWNCTISGNTYDGIFCNSYSSAKLSNPTTGAVHYGHNVVTNNNSLGIYGGNHSNIFLGDYQGGQNSIHNNSGYEVSAEYSSVIPAQYNYWARPAPNFYDWNDFSTFINSSIDPTHALSWNPNTSIQLASNNTEQPIQILKASIGNNSTDVQMDNIFLDEELMQAVDDLVLRNYDKAIIEYNQRLDKESNKDKIEYILTQLAECYLSSGREGFMDFLDQNVRKNLPKNDDLYLFTLDLENGSLMKEKDYSKVLENLNFIKSDAINTQDVYKETVFNLFCFYYSIMNDTLNTKKYLSELESKYPKDRLVIEANLMLGINNMNLIIKKVPDNNNLEEIGSKEATSYSLEQNYPNPFNPSTTISYNLPKTSFIEINIYDILGHLVKAMTIPSQSAGRHGILWDGTNSDNQLVASGIYLYHFKAVSLEGNNEVFEKTAKLLLMK